MGWKNIGVRSLNDEGCTPWIFNSRTSAELFIDQSCGASTPRVPASALLVVKLEPFLYSGSSAANTQLLGAAFHEVKKPVMNAAKSFF